MRASKYAMISQVNVLYVLCPARPMSNNAKKDQEDKNVVDDKQKIFKVVLLQLGPFHNGYTCKRIGFYIN